MANELWALETGMGKRVGLLGGTFNPAHRGHIDLGLRISEAFRLDYVLYILSAYPPHKNAVEIAPAAVRWQMLNAALAPYPRLLACDIEMKRDAPSWTIDTIRELTPLLPNAHFWFISGSEGFLKIRTWKEYSQLLKMISFIVMLRDEAHVPQVLKLAADEDIEVLDINSPGAEGAGGVNAINADDVADFCNITLSADAHDANAGRYAAKIYIYRRRSDKLYISSTLVRETVRRGGSIAAMVDEPVRKLVEEYRLYEH